jgi:tagatose 6-phosphate kinase
MAAVQKRVKKCRAVVMSGSITPGGALDLYFEVTRMAEAAGVLSVVDAQGPLLVKALEACPGLIKPNRTELAATVGRPLKTPSELRAAMREMCARGAQRIVVTAGGHATLAHDGRRFWKISPPQIKAVNPIGSGDAFTAGLVWRLLRGDDLGEACRWASATGAANALTIMAGEIRRSDVTRLAAQAKVENLRN